MNLEKVFASILFIGLVFLLIPIVFYISHRFFRSNIQIPHPEEAKKHFRGVFLRVLFLVLTLLTYFFVKYINILPDYSFYVDAFTFIVSAFLITNLIVYIIKLFIHYNTALQGNPNKYPELLFKFIEVAGLVIFLLFVLWYFRIDLTPFLATIGVGGLIAGFALQPTLVNFFAGFNLLSDKPIQIGDFVELPDINLMGIIEDIGWRSTRIRTLPNQIIVIPNSKLIDSIIVNDSKPDPEVAVLVQMGVAYNADLYYVEKVVLEVASQVMKSIPEGVDTFEPLVRFHTFGESNINFTVVLRARQYTDRFVLMHEFIKAIKKRFDEEGIEISIPARKLYIAENQHLSIKK
ncbi:MAG: mechanosensitive ion channel family protein [Candidatus Dojkabacteria bacterium]|nr:mechanosensitive ion channel family protein [Candidatus Dojkabacteria bacterium]